MLTKLIPKPRTLGPDNMEELMVQLRDLEVTEVEETGRELGKGAYGAVKEIRVKGHRCVCVVVVVVHVDLFTLGTGTD